MINWERYEENYFPSKFQAMGLEIVKKKGYI
jgi:hypothetical protein